MRNINPRAANAISGRLDDDDDDDDDDDNSTVGLARKEDVERRGPNLHVALAASPFRS